MMLPFLLESLLLHKISFMFVFLLQDHINFIDLGNCNGRFISQQKRGMFLILYFSMIVCNTKLAPSRIVSV